MEQEISLKELYQIVKKHFFTILIAMITGILALVLIMMFFITPKYSSEAQLLVNQQTVDSSQAQIQYNEIQTNIQLINTYSDIITGDSVLSQVNQNLGNQYAIKELSKAVSVGQSSNSQAFNLKVTMESPEDAQLVLNEIINVFESTIQDVYDVASIMVLSPASYNGEKVSPNLTIFILMGAVIGLAVSMIIILIIELMDTTVKEDEFVSQLGLINLGHVYELSNKELKESRLNSRTSKINSRERL